jgi:hypothetical protein
MSYLLRVIGVVVVGFSLGVGAYLASHNTGPIGSSTKNAQKYVVKVDGLGNVTSVPKSDEVKTVLRHPLIPGGLKNLKDFKEHVNRDSNLKRFYEANGFDFSCVSQDTLDQNEWAHVTYRSDKDIKWSNTPLLLLKGEMIFKDCQGHVIRAQCGNSVAYVKDDIGSLDLPISPLVETTGEGEIASITPVSITGTPPQAPILPIDIEGGTEGGGDYGGYGGFYGGGGGTGTPQKTPESPTGVLLGLGVLVLGLKKTLTNSKFSGKV